MYRLPQQIIQMVESRYGQSIAYPSDCDNLALVMSQETRQNISRNTVKRLMGFLASDSEPRTYTLDIVAHYLGYTHWQALVSIVVMKENSGFETDEMDVLKRVRINQRIIIKYDPERIIEAVYNGGRWLTVKNSINSKLLSGDEVSVAILACGQPMVADQVIRNGQSLGMFKAGRIGGITDIIL